MRPADIVEEKQRNNGEVSARLNPHTAREQDTKLLEGLVEG